MTPPPETPIDPPAWTSNEHQPTSDGTVPFDPADTAIQPAAADREQATSPGPGEAVVPSSSAPALRPPTWSGRKTAVAAALAVGLGVVGAVGAVAAVSQGGSQGEVGLDGRPAGGPGQGQFPGGTQGQPPGGGRGQGPGGGGGQVPPGQGRMPGDATDQVPDGSSDPSDANGSASTI